MTTLISFFSIVPDLVTSPLADIFSSLSSPLAPVESKMETFWAANPGQPGKWPLKWIFVVMNFVLVKGWLPE